MPAETRECDNCGEVITPRGGLPPLFCPRCGERLTPPLVEPPDDGVDWAARHVSGAAVTSLVLGIVGLLIPGCAPLGVAAIFFGVHARSSIEQSPSTLTGGGLAIAGIVLGVIGSAIWLAFCAALL